MLHHYTVTARPDGRWQGGQKNSLVPYMVADTQQEAEEVMCEMAQAMGRSQVVIYDADGAMKHVRSFGPVRVGRTEPLG